MRSTRSLSWIERLLGFGPVKAPPHVFGVGPGEVRYAAFAEGPQGWACEVERRAELPEDLFHHGVLGGPAREPAALSAAIGTLLQGLPEIEEASLVVPDTWLRITFTELAELPARPAQRQEMLAWKLKRLVPFRVEELRISATTVTPFPTQEEPLRLLLGFAVESLMAQLEAAFAEHGVRIGLVTNVTLALMSSIERTVAPEELAAIVAVHDDAYSLGFFRDGEPLLYRYKAFAEGGVFGDSVARDLRMTSSFLHQHFPDLRLARVVVAAPDESRDEWLQWIGAELDAVPEPLGQEHLELTRSHLRTPWVDLAPQLGAACLELG